MHWLNLVGWGLVLMGIVGLAVLSMAMRWKEKEQRFGSETQLANGFTAALYAGLAVLLVSALVGSTIEVVKAVKLK